ncbi:MAG: hypothetical protein IJ788_04210 [Oscillospiraceae bacterium]|nr:hypothetical protein [Oscillospiraceae bacterium]
MEELITILRAHAEKYPLMRPQDAVKLIYQNEFGGGHLILDHGWSLNYIRKEQSETVKNPQLPQLEDIGNGIVRVNLASTEMSPETLNEIFIKSAEMHRGDMSSFIEKLEILRLNADIFPFSAEELNSYLDYYISQGCPMVSHSDEYRNAYHPAYRVVMKSLIKTPRQEIEELKARIVELERRVYGYQPQPQYRPQPHYIQQNPQPVQKPAVEAQKKPKFSETSIGKYGVGIVAGLLILLAVALGIRNYWQYIPGIAKFSAILLIGTAVEALGWVNLRRTGKKNGFWSSVTGTGAAVVFIALVAGNLAWSLYGLVPTGLLLVAWFAVNFILAMKADSVAFYAVTYLGGAVSVLLSALKLREGMELSGEIGMLIIIAVIIAFGIVLRRKNKALPFFGFAFGAASFALILWSVYGGFDPGDGSMPLGIGLLALTGVMQLEGAHLMERESRISKWVNAIASFIAAFGVFTASSNLFSAYLNASAEVKDAVFASVSLVISVGTVLFVSRRADERLLAVSLFTAASLSLISQSIFGSAGIIPALSAALILALPARKNIYLRLSAYASFAVALWMNMDNGWDYTDSERTVSAIALIVPCAVEYVMTILDKDMKLRKTIGILALSTAFIASVPIDFEVMWKLLVFSTAIIFHRIAVMEKVSKADADSIIAWIFVYIALAFIHITVYIYALFNEKPLVEALASVILISLSVAGIYDAIRYKSLPIAILYVALANFNVFYLTQLILDSEAVLTVSVAGIVIAAGLICVGFIVRMKSLRILGLVSMLVYVLKIAFLDVPSLGGSGLNVILLAGAGLVCFGISFAYNKLDKYFTGRESELSE